MAKRTGTPLESEDKRKINKTNITYLLGVFRFILPYKGLFIFGLICLALSSFILLAFPRLAGELLDVASGNSKYFTTISQVVLSLLGILLIQSVFSFVRVYTFTIVSERGMSDVRKLVYQKIITLPMTFFDSRRIGELMSRITSDISTLQDTFSFTLAELLRQILTLIFGTAILFYFAPKLTAFMLLTFPVLVIGAVVFGKYIRKISKRNQDNLAQTNVIVEESLQSIGIVKSFTNEPFEIRRYNNSINEVSNYAIRSSVYRALFISFIIFAIFGGIVAVGAFGAMQVQAGEMDPGELFSFVLYTAFVGFSIAGLSDIYAQIQRSIGASERVLEILGQQEEESLDEKPVRLEGAIEFREVSFSYPTRPDFTVLRNLNFRVSAGEKIALIGQSGSGKSTIINLLMRYYPLTTGGIYIDERSIESYNLGGYRKNIGIVPQEVILFGGTIRENIQYGKPHAPFEEVKAAAKKANALEFIESFPEGFETVVGERGVKLSGGQRQRIAIARAILKDPAILILDEATSSLDVHSEVLVQEALEKLMQGRTTIVIAHRLSTIKKVDRIFVISEGGLVETGSHSELTMKDNGIYSNLLKLQLH